MKKHTFLLYAALAAGLSISAAAFAGCGSAGAGAGSAAESAEQGESAGETDAAQETEAEEFSEPEETVGPPRIEIDVLEKTTDYRDENDGHVLVHLTNTELVPGNSETAAYPALADRMKSISRDDLTYKQDVLKKTIKSCMDEYAAHSETFTTMQVGIDVIMGRTDEEIVSFMKKEYSDLDGESPFWTYQGMNIDPKNPKDPIMQWTEKMCKRADTIRIHTTYQDVPISWLGQKLIASAEAMKEADPIMYDWMWLGKCTGLEDVIYYMFDEKKHVSSEYDWQDISYIGIGVDYGQMNATTYEAYGVDSRSKRLQGLGEYYWSGRESQHQRSPSEYARDFAEFKRELEAPHPATRAPGETNMVRRKVISVFIDPSARGLAEEIRSRFGVEAAAPYSGSVFDLKKGEWIRLTDPVWRKKEGRRNENTSASREKHSQLYRTLIENAEALVEYAERMKEHSNGEIRELTEKIRALMKG